MSKFHMIESEPSAGHEFDIWQQIMKKLLSNSFDVATARESGNVMCDIFLAITGHFSLQHAKALMKGDDGCVSVY